MTVRSCQTRTAYIGSVTHRVSKQGWGTCPLYPTKLRLHFKSRAISDTNYPIWLPSPPAMARTCCQPVPSFVPSLPTSIYRFLVSVVLGMEPTPLHARLYHRAMHSVQACKQGGLWKSKYREMPPCFHSKGALGTVLSCLATGTSYSTGEDNSMVVPSTAYPGRK